MNARIAPVALAALTLLVVTAGARAVQAQAPGASSTTVALRDDDRIAFLGDSFFERDYPRGLIETALTAAHPGKTLTFRNLGWSGDTVRGDSRAYFGTPADGYAELLKSIDLVRPTVIFVSYGANESFGGVAALETFLANYGTLLDDLAARTSRIVLLTPLPADRATSPLPAAALDARNTVLSQYSEAIRRLAAARELQSIDLYTAMLTAMTRTQLQPLFEHGLHLTDVGYAIAASHIASRTGGTAIDGRDPRLARLRQLVVQKNELFFHRWRPANVTYLYLFRQREQGRNAVEIPRFDPLIAEREREIHALRRELAR